MNRKNYILGFICFICITILPASNSNGSMSNAAICCGQARRGAESLTFLTVNVWMEKGDSPHRWHERLPRIKSMIHTYENGMGPHIIGMQEVTSSHWNDLKAELTTYQSRYEDRGGDDDEGTSIFFRPDRVEYLDGGEIYMDRLARKRCGGCAGQTVSYTTKHRNVIWARFRDKETQKAFYVYNVHFGGNDCHKAGSAIILAHHIAKQAYPLDPVIVMGDFNVGIKADGGIEAPYTTMLHHTRLDNAYTLLHPTTSADSFSTKNSRIENNVRKDTMIDHVLFSPSFNVYDADIDRTMFTRDGRCVDCFSYSSDGLCRSRDGNATSHRPNSLVMYSDHWAVWAKLYLSGKPEVSGQSRLHLVSLTCNDALESEDEVYLKVDGRKVWGPVSMDNGNTASIRVSVPINNFASIELWEEDTPRNNPKHDNKLGCNITVPQGSRYNNVRINIPFSADKGLVGDARYSLLYYVETIPED